MEIEEYCSPFLFSDVNDGCLEVRKEDHYTTASQRASDNAYNLFRRPSIGRAHRVNVVNLPVVINHEKETAT